MSMLYRRFYLPVILIIALGWLVGCPAGPELGDPDPNGSDVLAPGTADPPDDGTENPPDDGTENPPDPPPDQPPAPSDNALADFKVADVNTASVRYQEDVSPRDYLGQVSAWYFGHST